MTAFRAAHDFSTIGSTSLFDRGNLPLWTGVAPEWFSLSKTNTLFWATTASGEIAWQDQASRCIVDALSDYEEYAYSDWDGYGAAAITSETVESARQLLGLLGSHVPFPDIAPGADGTIGFEWIFENGPVEKIYIDVGQGRKIRAYRRCRSGKIDQWETASNALSIVESLFPESIEREAE